MQVICIGETRNDYFYRHLYTRSPISYIVHKIPVLSIIPSVYPKFNIFIDRSFVFSRHNASFFMSIFFGVTRTPIEI